MKKTYQSPTLHVHNVPTEDLLKSGVSFYNDGKNSSGDDKQQGAGENNNANMEVDAKRYNAWNTWDDED